MRLRVLAPTIVDLSLRPGAAVHDLKGYQDFWQACRKRMTLPDGVRPGIAVADAEPTAPDQASNGRRDHKWLPHAEPPRQFNLYQKIDVHSLDRELEIIDLALDREALTDVVQPSPTAQVEDRSGAPIDPADLWELVDDIQCRVYDHGVALVEASADVTDLFCGVPRSRVARRLDELQMAAIDLGAGVSRAVHRTLADHVIARLREIDGADAVLMPARTADQPDGNAEWGQVLWVTRTLIVDRTRTPHADAVISHWIKDVPVADGDEPSDQLVTGKLDHLVRWLNYLFVVDGSATPARSLWWASTRARITALLTVDDDRNGPFPDVDDRPRSADQWQALRYAQYWYAALERINRRLGAILADSLAENPTLDLGHLREELERVSGRARMILMQVDDSAKYLKRSVRQEMEEILDYWGFEDLVQKPVQTKIASCEARLRELEAERSAHSSLWTDIILRGLLFTTVLGTAVGLAEFGRARTSDPSRSVVDFGGSDIISWFAAQPADAILIISFLASAVLILVLIYLRARTR